MNNNVSESCHEGLDERLEVCFIERVREFFRDSNIVKLDGGDEVDQLRFGNSIVPWDESLLVDESLRKIHRVEKFE